MSEGEERERGERERERESRVETVYDIVHNCDSIFTHAYTRTFAPTLYLTFPGVVASTGDEPPNDPVPDNNS